MGEKRYYPIVREWLEKQGYFCGGGMYDSSSGEPYMYQDRGSKRMRVDVAGVRNIGSKYADSIEVTCVEVKDSASVKFSDVTQAFGYSAIAHRVYLAHTAPLDENWERFLRRLGLGFLEIEGMRKGVIERVPSNHFNPNEANLLEFLRSLWIFKCSICGVYTFRWDTISNIEGSSYYSVKRRAQIDLHRLEVTAPYEKEVPRTYEIKRYICRSCLDDFFFKKGRDRFESLGQKWSADEI